MNRENALALARKHGLTALYVALALALVGWLSWESFVIRDATYSTRADFWEHAAVLHALIASPFHPQNPHLLSTASSPRFGPQFLLTALITRVVHGDALFGMSLVTTLNAALLVIGIYWFFTSYFRERWAPVYAILVMITGWWDAWGFSNVYQLHVLSSVEGYPSATALGSCLCAFALCLRILRNRTPRLLEGGILVALWAVIVIVHPLTAVLGLAGMGLLTISERAADFRGRALIYGALVLGLLLAQVWPYFSVWQTVVGGGGQEVASARPGHRLQEFYNWGGIANALGLALAAIAFLPYFLLKRERWFVGLGALSMLLPFVVNIYRELPLGHRFILLAVFFLHVGVVWLLLVLTPGTAQAAKFLDRPWRVWLTRAIVLSGLAVFLVHNIQLTKAECFDDPHVVRGQESPYVRLARAVARGAKEGSVVACDAMLGWPIPAFGPKVMTLYHGNPLVLDEPQRALALRHFLGSPLSDADRNEIITRYGITHVLVTRPARGALGQYLARVNAAVRPADGYFLYALPRQAPAQ